MNGTQEIIAIIPARCGSKGVPNKNIYLLNNKPVISYSIVAALKSNLIDRVIVSTDSEEYADIAREQGAEVPFMRPTNISDDAATDTQFFVHAIDMLKKSEGKIPEYFVHLRPTTPLRNPEIIDDAIRKFINSDYTALRSVHKMSESSYKNFEIENGKLKMLNGDYNIDAANRSRQLFPDTFNANGYVDIVRTSFIEKYGIIHGDKVMAYLTDISYEIDDVNDLEFIEFLIQKKPELMSDLFSTNAIFSNSH